MQVGLREHSDSDSLRNRNDNNMKRFSIGGVRLPCTVGPDWPCMLCTYALVTIPTGLFLAHIAVKVSIVVVGVGGGTYLACILCYR